jgi:hypothetical protein
MFEFQGFQEEYVALLNTKMPIFRKEFSIGVGCVILMETLHFIKKKEVDLRVWLREFGFGYRWVIYSLLLAGLFFFGRFENDPFIYFQF